MGVRKNESMGFVDAALDGPGGTRSATLQERLDSATPWDKLSAPIRILPEYNAPGAGRPPWCPVLMVKCLMLQKCNNLSDPGLEDALRHVDDRTMHETRLVLADSDYSDRDRREELRARGVIDGICCKRCVGSRSCTHGRSGGRHRGAGSGPCRTPDGMMKQQLGYKRVRCRGMERDAFDVAITVTACNVKRSLGLKVA